MEFNRESVEKPWPFLRFLPSHRSKRLDKEIICFSPFQYSVDRFFFSSWLYGQRKPLLPSFHYVCHEIRESQLFELSSWSIVYDPGLINGFGRPIYTLLWADIYSFLSWPWVKRCALDFFFSLRSPKVSRPNGHIKWISDNLRHFSCSCHRAGAPGVQPGGFPQRRGPDQARAQGAVPQAHHPRLPPAAGGELHRRQGHRRRLGSYSARSVFISSGITCLLNLLLMFHAKARLLSEWPEKF